VTTQVCAWQVENSIDHTIAAMIVLRISLPSEPSTAMLFDPTPSNPRYALLLTSSYRLWHVEGNRRTKSGHAGEERGVHLIIAAYCRAAQIVHA
jgi:hypothetical protein